jgi:superfamily II DNA or RNA helicase
VLLTSGGLVLTSTCAAPLEENAPFEWIQHLRKHGRIEASDKEKDELLTAILQHPSAPPLAVPEELRYEEIGGAPRRCLRLRAPERHEWQQTQLRADLSFDYAGKSVDSQEPRKAFYDPAQRQLLRRDHTAEVAASDRLVELGLKLQTEGYPPRSVWRLAQAKLPSVARALVLEGWHIEAEGKMFRAAGKARMEISSGVDWFELHGEIAYGEASVKLPALLQAIRRGEKMVRLDDGTYGLLPEEWLGRFASFAQMGAAVEDHVRFRRNQAGLLDALLAAQPDVPFDAAFAQVREQLHRFDGIRPAEQPAGFVGHLRDYQREGVGWMQFLRQFGFGGCLADDMGVGKTAQVLALLEERRVEGASPSLVVVPRSLVFNWIEEAARFTPQLRVLDHTGSGRSLESLGEYNVVLATYGTLRRDIVSFQSIEFDYIVLDEAQAIKNAETESAKAARLLRGHNRLALSGTPVENHLGELWSLFEFLNPGMLGAASVFKLTGSAMRKPDEQTRKLLAHALRPFILRRTKQQVARELPAKTEQTIYCDMEPPQRRLYDELRAHYRSTLLKRIDQEGMAKSKMHVLEALLRLRQAACHPGLLDAKRSADPSAKLDLLMYRLTEVLEEGHKALVFSQFTSLLKILRDRLDAAGITYEYLDGATRDRQACVQRFQNDAACPLFLISLKAGGLGLNLTAAEYVFILDPWWNPAVEAQAIDRTHRIGQTRQVFAYRLIARKTVEEKVLELQNTKRDLAAAIIDADASPIGNLRREDLELLLS